MISRVVIGVMIAASFVSRARAEPRFESGTRGAFVDGAIGSTNVGDTLMFELGGESAGIRTYGDRRWIFQWDVLGALRGGWLANEHPFLFLFGVHTSAWTEGGYRLLPAARWSPYVGARIGGDVVIVAAPSVAAGSFDTINSVDGVGSVTATGTMRVSAGVSMLEGRHSFLANVFAQEALRAPEIVLPSAAFSEVGIGARFDVAKRVVASVEAVWGVTPNRADARGFVDQTTHLGVSAMFQKIFANGMWLGASVSWTRDSDHVAYVTGLTYATTDAPTFNFMLSYGIPLWRSRR